MTIHKHATGSDLFKIEKVSGLSEDAGGRPRVQLIPSNLKTKFFGTGVRSRWLYFGKNTWAEKEGMVFIQFLLNEKVTFDTDIGTKFLDAVGLTKCGDKVCERPYHFDKKLCQHNR